MNTIINDGFLKTKFDVFDKLTSETEQDTYLEEIASEFEALSDDKQHEIQQEWLDNVQNIGNRLEAIKDEIKTFKTIEVYTQNEEEVNILKTLLTRMNIQFSLK